MRGQCITLVAWETNVHQDLAANSDAQRTRLSQLTGVGQEVSRPFDHAARAYTTYRIHETNFQGEPAAFNQILPPGTTRGFHSTSSSVFSFISFVPRGLSRQHAHEFHHHMSAGITFLNSEAMDKSGGSSTPQSLTTGVMSTTYTPASSADVSDILPPIDDVTPTVEELNAHRYSHDLAPLPEPHLEGILRLEDDLAFDMDVVGIGEQFTGMPEISSETLWTLLAKITSEIL